MFRSFFNKRYTNRKERRELIICFKYINIYVLNIFLYVFISCFYIFNTLTGFATHEFSY